MSRWFRAYDDALDDPKVQRLSDANFRAWFNLMCVTSKNDGAPFNLQEIEFRLRLTPAKAKAVVSALVEAGLLDEIDGRFVSHNWSARQFKSDVSNDRVKRHRQRRVERGCNVTSSVTVTPPETEQNRTEDEREIRAQAPSLISEEAKALGPEFCSAVGLDPEEPRAVGLPYQLQVWLASGIPKDFILARASAIAVGRSKVPHLNYFDAAIKNAWAEQQSQPKTQGKPHGSYTRNTAGNVVVAADRLLEKLAEFDRPPPDFSGAREVCSGQGPPDVRLLSKG